MIRQTEENLYRETPNGLYIGHNKIDDNFRRVLKDEANYILRSRIWEVLNDTVANEAAQLALQHSLNWEHVLSAKQLYYWQQAMSKIMQKLAH